MGGTECDSNPDGPRPPNPARSCPTPPANARQITRAKSESRPRPLGLFPGKLWGQITANHTRITLSCGWERANSAQITLFVPESHFSSPPDHTRAPSNHTTDHGPLAGGGAHFAQRCPTLPNSAQLCPTLPAPPVALVADRPRRSLTFVCIDRGCSTFNIDVRRPCAIVCDVVQPKTRIQLSFSTR